MSINFITQVQKEVLVKIEDVLIFFSGINRIPSVGFHTIKPTLEFLHMYNPQDILATASTCDLTLRIPVSHKEDQDSFNDKMILSLKGCSGFNTV